MSLIGIITYPFVSGLYYLAESFTSYQKSIGNDVVLIPKKSYVKHNNGWRGIFKYELDGFLKLDEEISYGLQILNFCKKNDIAKIYSFETFMRDSSWIKILVSNNIKVIDIPMPEWSFSSDLINGKYKEFSEVYCLTNQSYSIFSPYSNARKFSWDYCPDILAVKKERNVNPIFYHPGSNSEVNQKNTRMVLEGFSKVKIKEIALIFSGHNDMAITDHRVKFIGKKIPRQNIIEAYLKSDCIISPSTREGLGMSFFEAKKLACDIITTDTDPMREHSSYLCKVSGYNKSESLIPHAIVDSSAIAEQITKYCEDFYGSKK